MTSERLDMTSSAFDPKEVLMLSDIVLPCPNARIYNNLAEFEVHVLKGKPFRQVVRKNTEKDKSLPSTVTNENVHQSSVATTSKQKTDVLIRMKTAFNKGPLNLLNKCVQQRIRVKVSIRNYADIRGSCTGFIVAFDKHWNLAMRDVDETYLKCRTLKTPVLKILPSECCRTVTTSETVEYSECDADDCASDVENASDTLESYCTKLVEETLQKKNESDKLPVLGAENVSETFQSQYTKPSEETSENKTGSDNLSILKTSDILQESVTRLNLEDLNYINKNNEKDVTSETTDLKSRKYTSVVPVTKIDSKTLSTHYRRKKKQPEICQRHVNQLFVRGDNVVFIRLLS